MTLWIGNCAVFKSSSQWQLKELAFGVRGHWCESYPDLIFLPCIYSFVSLLRTLLSFMCNEIKRLNKQNHIEPQLSYYLTGIREWLGSTDGSKWHSAAKTFH